MSEVSEPDGSQIEGKEEKLLPPLPEIDLQNNKDLAEVMDTFLFSEDEKERMLSDLADYLPTGDEQMTVARRKEIMDQVVNNQLSIFPIFRACENIKLPDEKETNINSIIIRGAAVIAESLFTDTIHYLESRDKIESEEKGEETHRHTEAKDVDFVLEYNPQKLVALGKKFREMHENDEIVLKNPDMPVAYRSFPGMGASSHIDGMWSNAFIGLQIPERGGTGRYVDVEMFADYHVMVVVDAEDDSIKPRYQPLYLVDIDAEGRVGSIVLGQKDSSTDDSKSYDDQEIGHPYLQGKAQLATYLHQARYTRDSDAKQKAMTRVMATLIAMEARERNVGNGAVSDKEAK